MTAVNDAAAHLTDEEIDAYWKGELDQAIEERLEEHYVECIDCGRRVAAVETLVDGLRGDALPSARALVRLRGWQAAAAALAVVAAGAAWQLARLGGPPQGRAPDAGMQLRPSALNTIVVALAPATRAEVGSTVPLRGDMNVVVFELDVREANAPTGPYEVALEADGRILLRLSGIVPGAAGTVRIPVASALLAHGTYAFSATTGAMTITFPFLIPPG